MSTELIEAISQSHSMHPDVVYSLLAPHLQGAAAKATGLAELKTALPPNIAHQLDYNLSIVSRGQRIHGLIKRYLTHRDNPSVLDIGSGFGGMLLPFGRDGFALHGIELDPARRNMCAKNLSHLGLKGIFYDVDLCERGLGDLRFDVIICNSVIEHVSDPVTMIERIGHMLTPGGVLFFGVANRSALGNVIEDPHYGVFGLTLMPNGLAQRYYLAVADKPQRYSVTDFFSVECYHNLLAGGIGTVHRTEDQDGRSASAFPDLLARVTSGYRAALASTALGKDKLLRRQFELIVMDYLRRVTSGYAGMIENGTSRAFTETFIRKSYQIIAVKPDEDRVRSPDLQPVEASRAGPLRPITWQPRRRA